MALDILGTPGSGSTTLVSGTYSGFTYTAPTGNANRMLVLFLGAGDVSFTVASAVTYGGQAMTQIPGWLFDDGSWTSVQAWYLMEAGIAAASTNVFAVTIAGGAELEHLILGAAMFQDVHQTVTFGTVATATGASTTPSVTVTSATGELIIANMATDDNNAFVQAQTLIFEVEGVGADTGSGAQRAAGQASLAMQWTTDNFNWCAAGISIKPVAAAPGGKQRKGLIVTSDLLRPHQIGNF